ncbi:MAG: DUF6152 family protein [Rhodospirillales bacterium]|nr:DUF6152 family protein [Rhodospirillales bacterium]
MRTERIMRTMWIERATRSTQTMRIKRTVRNTRINWATRTSLIYRRILLPILLSCAPAALQAHHSVTLNFTDDQITLQGMIASLRWVNPHCTFVLQVENDAGETEEWMVEMLARIALERQGFDFEWLHEGMAIQLTGRLGYRENNLLFVRAVRPDGSIVRQRSPLEERFRRQ